MKINENVKIIGKNVILIPYEVKHVPKYHEWMQNTELQELTASELLTIEQEYEMQASWRLDEDNKELFFGTQNEIESLIGDTNLFLQNNCENNEIVGEAEIMIAEESARGKHYGWESMLLMLKYGIQFININKFIVKINKNNIKSINMFKKMKFIEINYSAVFCEVKLELIVDDKWREWLNINIFEWNIINYIK